LKIHFNSHNLVVIARIRTKSLSETKPMSQKQKYLQISLLRKSNMTARANFKIQFYGSNSITMAFYICTKFSTTIYINVSQTNFASKFTYHKMQDGGGRYFGIRFNDCRHNKHSIKTRDSNPGPVFSIPGFGIGEFIIPGSRDPGGITGCRWYQIKNRYY